MKPNAVAIVSAFGRADGLAIELQKSGFEVSLVDCTHLLIQGQNLGAGPFPILANASMGLELEKTVLSDVLDRGLVFWLPEGPIELDGPLAEFFKSQKEELRQLELLQSGKKATAEFSKTWLWPFLHQLACPWFFESTKATAFGTAFLPQTKMFLVNSTNFLKSLAKATIDVGVVRFQPDSLDGIKIENNRVISLDLKTNALWDGKFSNFVWALNSYESHRVSQSISELLFNKKVLAPTWQWVKFELRSSVGTWSNGFPAWQVVIEDIYLPWSHTNSFILQKGAGGHWDVWLKVPHHRIENPQSWYEWARGIESVLMKRVPHGQWVCDEASLKTDPQGMIFDLESIGWQPPKLQNLYYCASEVMTRLDWSHWSDQILQLLPKIDSQKNREQKKYKGASSDQALHAP